MEAQQDDAVTHASRMMNPMRSSFHIEIPFTILFEEWNVTNTKDVLLSCLLLMILSFFNESLKHVRSYINTLMIAIAEHEKKKQNAQNKAGLATVIQYPDGCRCVEVKSSVDSREMMRPTPCWNISKKLKTAKIPLHITCCLIYGLQMFISFGLMLTVMSFHTGVIASIVAGGVIGKAVFEWPAATKITRIPEQDACH